MEPREPLPFTKRLMEKVRGPVSGVSNPPGLLPDASPSQPGPRGTTAYLAIWNDWSATGCPLPENEGTHSVFIDRISE